MAVAFDVAQNARTAGVDTSFVTSITISLTVGSGSDRALVVWAEDYADATHDVNDVTYAGAALTQEREDGSTAAFDVHDSLWWKAAPASGANNLVVTATVSCEHLGAAMIAVTGADQTDPINASTRGTGTVTAGDPGTEVTVAVASAVDDLVLGFFVVDDSDSLIVAGSGSTERTNSGIQADGWPFAGETEPGAASVTIGFSTSPGAAGSAPYRLMGCNVPQVAAAAGQPMFRRYGGVPYTALGGRKGNDGGGVWG